MLIDMAIQVSKDDSNADDPKLILTVNNGDYSAIKQALERTGFINEEALLRYMLVALLRTEDNKLYIKQNGTIVGLIPQTALIKPDDPIVS